MGFRLFGTPILSWRRRLLSTAGPAKPAADTDMQELRPGAAFPLRLDHEPLRPPPRAARACGSFLH